MSEQDFSNCFQPLKVGEILSNALKLSWDNIALFTGLSLICKLPSLPWALIAITPTRVNQPIDGELLALFFVSAIENALLLHVLTLVMSRRLVGLPTTIGWVFIHAFQYPFMRSIIGYLLSMLLIYTTALFLVVPGLFMASMLIPFLPLIILEQKNLLTAFSESYTLMKAHIFSGIMVFLYYISISILLPLLLQMIIIGESISIASQLSGTLIYALAMPPSFAAYVVMYASLRGTQGHTAEQFKEALQ